MITESELLEALRSAVAQSDAPKDARTVPELAAEMGRNPKLVREGLAVLKAQGRLVLHKVRREGIDGRNSLVPAYTIRDPA